MKSNACGVDFGTSNSTVGWLRSDAPTLLPLEDGKVTLPSVIFFHAEDPLVSYGRWYEGPRVSENPYRDGMEPPLVYWVPSIATSGMTFYTNDRIPQWKGNLFVGGMQQGRIPGTGQIQRISFNSRWEEVSREPMLGSLNQRMREIREGPDGSLYILTDEDAGVLLRVEPTDTTKRTAK